MNEDKKHTPLQLYAYKNYVSDKTTFSFDESGARIGETPNICFDAGSEDNAKFIVRACNSHYELLGELQRVRTRLSQFANQSKVSKIHAGQIYKLIFDLIEPAIAKAEGK